MRWISSDLHFGHEAIVQLSRRPFSSVEEMNRILIERWNAKVRPEDEIFVLGDLALCTFKEFEPIARRLNGKKTLVLGNHDHYSEGQYNKLGFQVFHELKMKLAGKDVRMSHFPWALPWYKRPFAYKSELRYLERRPPRIAGEWLLHGHSHVKYKKARKQNRIHVGCDASDYYPISFRELESLMNKKD